MNDCHDASHLTLGFCRSCETTADRVVKALRPWTFQFCDEDELQQGIASVLNDAKFPFERECALSSEDRPDFMVAGSIAIEAKIKSSASALLRQLARYAKHDAVKAMVVVCPVRLSICLPRFMNEKPVYCVTVASIFG